MKNLQSRLTELGFYSGEADGDVQRAGVVRRVVKEAGAVRKLRVLQAELLRAPVHPLHEGGLGAAQVLREGHGAVVGRDHGHALYHVRDGELLADLQPDLAAAHGGRALRGRDHVVERELAGVHRLGY